VRPGADHPQGALIVDSTSEGLKASTMQSTLEDVFRTLTHSESTDHGVSRNYRCVHWFYTFEFPVPLIRIPSERSDFGNRNRLLTQGPLRLLHC
jgi:hypothetical protein